MPHCLLVDDDAEIRTSVQSFLSLQLADVTGSVVQGVVATLTVGIDG